ncbi:hypothetical protein EDD17DRAFT_1505753 [Pisolithus thermaeus]|nr:hypothetical protein EV401DRAFT_1883398 [Pisolithus croceorrhizus]KAI6165740.1 hypothetical protein EDD17DRAFT_1505753 [Pisolithus thermaeus]
MFSLFLALTCLLCLCVCRGFKTHDLVPTSSWVYLVPDFFFQVVFHANCILTSDPYNAQANAGLLDAVCRVEKSLIKDADLRTALLQASTRAESLERKYIYHQFVDLATLEKFPTGKHAVITYFEEFTALILGSLSTPAPAHFHDGPVTIFPSSFTTYNTRTHNVQTFEIGKAPDWQLSLPSQLIKVFLATDSDNTEVRRIYIKHHQAWVLEPQAHRRSKNTTLPRVTGDQRVYLAA